MNKNILILLLLLLLVLICGYFLFFNHVPDVGKMIEAENRRERDSLMALFRGIQVDYNMKQEQVEGLEAELSKQKNTVTATELKLMELLKRENNAKKENKMRIDRYSNYQLDSAFMAMYPVPDSVRN